MRQRTKILIKLIQITLFLLQQQQSSAQFLRKPKSSNQNGIGAPNSSGPGSGNNVVAEMQVVCHSDSIELKMNTNSPFNGMVYAKDAPNNSNCVGEYNSSRNMTFKLPLKSCGTLFAEADDGIEFFNTVVVQPHMRLMTNQGKGYHIRCKYQTRERTIANTLFNVSASFLMQNNPQVVNTPLLATASMPSCTMKIFRSGRDDVAETVKIGDKLIMVIEIDQQDMYGMRVTNCVVRDGLNMAEQLLINDGGCPIDETIMPNFEYTNNSTRAAVSFPAHKFPHTSSVYYQCNVRLCINNNGGCNQLDCNGTTAAATSGGGPRKKRFSGHDHKQLVDSISGPNQPVEPMEKIPALPQPGALSSPGADGVSGAIEKQPDSDMSFDVYSGLYVSDIDVGESGSSDRNTKQINQPNSFEAANLNSELRLTLGQVSLIILIASFVTMVVVLLLACQVGIFDRRDEQQVSSKLFSGFLSPIHHSSRRYYRHGEESSIGGCASGNGARRF